MDPDANALIVYILFSSAISPNDEQPPRAIIGILVPARRSLKGFCHNRHFTIFCTD